MSFLRLLNDSCVIQRRTTTAGKVDTHAWRDTPAVKCRILNQAISARNLPKTERATAIRTRFVLAPGTVVSIRDRISHDDTVYEVIKVNRTIDGRGREFHVVAICEGIQGV